MPKRPRDTFPLPGRYVADTGDVDCPICLEPFWQPTRAEPCGHVGCRDCLDRLDQCPMCRAEVQSTTPCDAAVSRRSHSARVSCPTCSWTGTRKQQVTQAHVMCPVVCKQQAEEKMAAVMRDVYPRAEFTRFGLVAFLENNPLAPGMTATRNWNGRNVVIDDNFFVQEMIVSYCPNLVVKHIPVSFDTNEITLYLDLEQEKNERRFIITEWAGGKHAALQSLSGPASCLLWTLLDTCSTSNTELAVGLALRALAIPPTSPDAFPAGLDWQYACLLVAMKSNNSTLRELLRIGITVPNPLPSSEYFNYKALLTSPIKVGDFECLRLLVENCRPFIDFAASTLHPWGYYVSGFSTTIMMSVIKQGRRRWIRRLVTELGCDIHEPYREQSRSGDSDYVVSTLARAVIKNQPNCLAELINLGVNLNERNAVGSTALHTAAREENVECLQMLLAAGASTELVDWQGCMKRRALHVAVMWNKTDHVKALIVAGADTKASYIDLDGYTSYALHAAVTNNNPNIVSLLLGSGGDGGAGVDNESGYNYNTALHAAVQHPDSACLQLLLLAKANTGIRNYMGWTPLHIAARRGNLHHITALVSAKADVHEVVNTNPFIDTVYFRISDDVEKLFDRNPLGIAAQYGTLDMVTYLHKTTKLKKNSTLHRNMMIHAVYNTRDTSVLEFLVNKGYPVSHFALGMAILLKNVAAIGLFIQPRFKLDITSSSISPSAVSSTANGPNSMYGSVAMHVAVENRNSEMIEALFDRGADMCPELNYNLLRNGHIDSLFYLLQLRAYKQRNGGPPAQPPAPNRKGTKKK